MFILLRIAWMAAMTYATARILEQISGLRMEYSIVIMSAVTLLYTVTGGMAAVVWTDVLQFFVFVGGILCIAGLLIWQVGGVGEIFSIAHAHDKLRLFGDLGLDFHKRLTFWGLLIGVSFVNLDYYGVDQMVLQRYLSAQNKLQARRALIFNACFGPPFAFVLYFIGLGLFAFYLKFPQAAKGMASATQVLPYFIVNEIPRGLAGLIVAAVFAATMSSISAGLNSLATATVVDFYERLRGRPATASDAVTVSRLATLGYGILITLIAYAIMLFWNDPRIIELTYYLSNPFTGATLGLFLIGLFSRRVSAIPAFIGAIVGLVTVASIIPTVSFLWFSATSCLTTMAVAWVLSFFYLPPPRESLGDLTIYDRSK
jgi:sodium-coupled monocarboxylate transporter 8/12